MISALELVVGEYYNYFYFILFINTAGTFILSSGNKLLYQISLSDTVTDIVILKVGLIV